MPRSLRLAALAVLLSAAPALRAGAAGPDAPVPAAMPAPAAPSPLPAVPVPAVQAGAADKPAAAVLTETQQYCQNIAAAAADARFAWQRKQITDLEAKLASRTAELEEREAALQDLLARRDALMKRAGDTVVGIYAAMKPDAAAQQIAVLDDDMAAAILAQLAQKKASLILNEIPADRAAKLVGAIAAAALQPPGKRS